MRGTGARCCQRGGGVDLLVGSVVGGQLCIQQFREGSGMSSSPVIDSEQVLDFYIFDGLNKKASDITSVNSEKVFRLFNTQLNCNRPFKRKQEKTNNSKKKQVLDMGKLIKNTSLTRKESPKVSVGPSSDVKKEGKYSKQQLKKSETSSKGSCKFVPNSTNESEVLPRAASLRNFNSLDDMHVKTKQQNKQQLVNEIRLLSAQNHQLKNKIEMLESQKKDLQFLNDSVMKNYAKLEAAILDKEQLILKISAELQKTTECLQQQKQVTHWLEEVIDKLNDKVQGVIKKSREELEKQVSKDSPPNNKQQLQLEIQQLRESTFAMKKRLQSAEVQNMVIGKLRSELQKQKIMKQELWAENRCLRERVANMKKSMQNRISKENCKMSVKKELQYSISFTFDK